MNLVCCICTELLNASADVLSTPCGHLFHSQCVHQWLVRSKSCPHCRFSFSPRTLHKIYFNIGASDASFTETSVLQLQHINDDLKLEISENKKKIKDLESKLTTEQVAKMKMAEKYQNVQEKIRSSQFLVDTLREQLRLVERENDRYKEVQQELNKANAKLETVKLIQQVIDNSAKEAEDIINRSETNVTTLAVLVATLKRELVSSEGKRKEISSYLENSQNECKRKEEQFRKLFKAFEQLKEKTKRINEEIANTRINGTNIIDENIDENVVLPAPLEPQGARKLKRSNTTGSICDSPTIHENVRIIEESTSPYLHIKSSSVGLAPLQLKGPSNQGPAKYKQPNLLIFKKPRLTDSNNMRRGSDLGNKGLIGFGSSERRPFNMHIEDAPKLKKMKPFSPKKW